jgi:hypothetical protein
MDVLVSVDTARGVLRRYESGGARPRLTHQVECEAPLASMPPAVVRDFLRNPDLGDYVGPPVGPTLPPGPIGGAPAMRRAA